MSLIGDHRAGAGEPEYVRDLGLLELLVDRDQHDAGAYGSQVTDRQLRAAVAEDRQSGLSRTETQSRETAGELFHGRAQLTIRHRLPFAGPFVLERHAFREAIRAP